MTRLTIYGDFNCPFSALASVRADLLLGADWQIDWRAVQHDTTIPVAGDPVEGDLIDELAAEVAKIRELSTDDVRLAADGAAGAFEHRRRVRLLRRRR